MQLLWNAKFIRDFKRLARRNPELRSVVEQRLQELAEDPFYPSLRTHKLKGDLLGTWACSIDYNNRILFEFVPHPHSGELVISLLTLGSHDDVY
ncbi:type II toxin-antitoxin system mRNA interferase toxin, RelE/StbE family [Nostoc sp. CHAB 5836]|uniref:type II toxin-antitoxin system RelE/ParE family toxin n=1 Tax=Nostoc sp. CHAB 5836 TaxID=2780404 RepID=UPI001E44815F|nr:type II toxin-antitoxin system mRNA interferase toxin, RelE/StbE family [Nostoc sp. CHAB 5836]MCC5618881.1 type II toxin-antitoxin system mRNA interferase toxin, RelE/StbE family [Nostoc sp. CHAB 5836]